jgi:hypothetical protein
MMVSAQPLKLTPNNAMETLESLWQENTPQLGYVLQLKPQHMLFVCPYASIEIS